MRAFLIIAALASLLSGCAAGPQTASGRPELLLHDITMDEVRERLVTLFAADNWIVERAENMILSFAKPSDDFATRLLLGSRYDGQPYERVTVTLVSVAGTPRIYAHDVFVTNYGSAYERLTDCSGSKAGAQLQTRLETLFAGKCTPTVAKVMRERSVLKAPEADGLYLEP